MKKDPCMDCDAYDCDFGCTMPSIHKWYACPIESELPENQAKLQEMEEFYIEAIKGSD